MLIQNVIEGTPLRSGCVTHEKDLFSKINIHAFFCYQRISCIKTYILVPHYVLYRSGNSV